VYTADPKRIKTAKLLRDLSPGNLERVDASAKMTDVTGGLAGKLQRMIELARYVPRCILVNGLKKGRLLAALRHEPVVGTRVTP